ncbi:MAG: hypothetical protein H6Q73_174 [Firmicutes bacterium]|nr:hypothetical protein [Bacillota bacterium]
MREIEKVIREKWFKDHIATLTQHGDLQVLDWGRPDSITLYCRYVFDGSKMYISGDIGEAVFNLTWKAGVHTFDDVNIGYFKSKMSAFCDEKIDFDSDEAVKGLREWLKRLRKDQIDYDHDQMKDLFDLARGCENRQQWGWRLQDHRYYFIEELDRDYWEWIYSVGDVIPARVYAYLIGLKMASEQLREAVA